MLHKEFRKRILCSDGFRHQLSVKLRPDSGLIMIDRQTEPSSVDIKKMQFMRVTNFHHSEIFRL